MIEFEQVTTRGGDRGETSLYNGERRRKDDLLIVALGDVDEASSALGVVRAHLETPRYREQVYSAQQVLFKVGALLATPPSDPLFEQIRKVEAADIEELERRERDLLSRVEIGNRFVTPGEDRLSAFIHLARSVSRRAERAVVACIRERGMIHLALAQNYTNRLSDYLFVLAAGAEQGLVT